MLQNIVLYYFISLNILSVYCSTFEDDRNYFSFDEMTSFMRNLSERYSNVASVKSIGTSVNNRNLWVMHISDNIAKLEIDEPSVKLVGNIHGNDVAASELLLNLIEYLLNNYENDFRVASIINTTNIYILPSLNPDGREKAQEGDCVGTEGRGNANDVDLNRDFVTQATEDGFQPETLAVMDWIQNSSFVLSAGIHAGCLGVSYPFDSKFLGSNGFSPDEDVFASIATAIGEQQKQIKGHKKCNGEAIGVTRGSLWKPFSDGMQDYNYLKSNCFEVTLCVSCCKYPRASELNSLWLDNKDAFITFLEQAHRGIKGRIISAETKNGIEAFITVGDKSKVVTSNEAGYYWRLLVPGSYTITVEAEGYEPQTVKVDVTDKTVLVLDFLLKPIRNIWTATPFLSDVNITMPEATLMRLLNRLSDAQHRDDMTFNEPSEFVYLDHTQLETTLKQLAADYPNITRLYSIGQSVEGRKLWVLEISDFPGVHEAGEPEVKYIANMHGNEVVGRVLLVALAELLCRNYGSDLMLTLLVNNTRIHLMPTMNPDGFYRSSEGDVDGIVGRANAAGVDLNRNFPDRIYPASTTGPLQSETLALMKWTTSYPFVLSANFHGGSLVANYPYDDDDGSSRVLGHPVYAASPDDETFKVLAESYSLAHSTMHNGRPCADTNEYFPDGITNGAAWYSVGGGMQDWNYLHSNCFEITVELGCTKYPDHSLLPQFWTANKYSLLVFIGQVHKAVHGFVLDGSNGLPLANASIFVENVDHLVRSAADGDYWRLLAPGTYNITVVVPGYRPTTKLITVTTEAIPQTNFTLMPILESAWSVTYDFDIEDNLRDIYLTDNQIDGELLHLAKKYSQIVTLRKFDGIQKRSISYHTVSYVKLNDPKFTDEKINIAIMAAVNSSSALGSEIALRFLRHLTKGYEVKDPRISTLLSKAVIYILPRLLPSSIDDDDFMNCISVADDFNFGAELENNPDDPKVLALKELFESHMHVVLQLDGGGLFVRYPPNKPRRDNLGELRFLTEDDSSFRLLAATFAAAHPQLTGNIFVDKQCPTFPLGFVHGTEWRSLVGAMMDTVYFKYHTLMLTAHLSCCSTPNPKLLPSVWHDSLEPLMLFCERTVQGVSGYVKNRDGAPLASATLTLNGNELPIPLMPSGFFHHVLADGNSYQLTASAPGYQSQTLSTNLIFDHKTETLNFRLIPEITSLNYHDFSSLSSELVNISRSYHTITHLRSIGHSVQNQQLWVMEIGAGAGGVHQPGIAEVKIIAGLHGTDRATTEILLQFIKFLCEGYNTNDYHTTEFLSKARLHALLLANPDGSDKNTGDDCNSGEGHLNANNVDLETNFMEGVNVTVEPETLSIMEWSRSQPFVLSIHLAAGESLVEYPYSQPSYRRHNIGSQVENAHFVDDPFILQHLALTYTNAHPYMHLDVKNCSASSKNINTVKGIINSAAWKPRKNSMQDWNHDNIDCPELTAYVSCCEHPPAESLHELWHQNYGALWTTLQQVRFGIKGFVKDQQKKPISNAVISIKSPLILQQTSLEGDFWLLVPSGTYELEVSFPGYLTIKQTVQVTKEKEIMLDIVLTEGLLFGLPLWTLVLVFAISLGVILMVIVICCRLCVKLRRRRNEFQRLATDDFADDSFLSAYEMKTQKRKHHLEARRKLLNRDYLDSESSGDEAMVYHKTSAVSQRL